LRRHHAGLALAEKRLGIERAVAFLIGRAIGCDRFRRLDAKCGDTAGGAERRDQVPARRRVRLDRCGIGRGPRRLLFLHVALFVEAGFYLRPNS